MNNTVALLNEHPLLSRLSGQIIWYLFEENNASQEIIDTFMDHVDVLKQEVAQGVAQLKDPDHVRRFPLMRLTLATDMDETGPACADCARLNGICIDRAHADAIRFLPPFGLGCRLRYELLPADAPECSELPVLPTPPETKLYCSSEWLFKQPYPHKG